ncbi:MAG TPA: branched-chain amino acid ABC transporter substrate-binding protein [Acidimicrobiales bacterium]|nr:branched-chain amino acid ABC transporter substrate-binding protein [Acidimicrobiales bacterium]
MRDCRRGTSAGVARGGRLLVAALVVGVSLAACGSAGSPNAGAATVKIAIEGPMTGPQSSTGIDMWRGAQLLANRVNAAGGVLGRRLQLVQVDDKADAATAAATARKAVSQGVSAVIGPYNSAVGLANLPVYLHAHVITIRLTSNQKTNRMGITVQPMDYQVAPIEAAAVQKSPAIKRVGIVYDTSAYTSGVAAQMRSLLTGAGVQVPAFESIQSDQSDFHDVLTQLKATNADLDYFVAYDPQAEDLVQQAAAVGVPGECLVDGLAAQGPTFLKTVPLALAERCVFSGVPTADQMPDALPYLSAYRAAYHQDPGTWGAFSYDSLGVLVSTVQSVHSWEWSRVEPGLFHVSGYRGITGTISIDPPTGNRLNPPLVMQVVDPSGRYVVPSDWTANGRLPVLPKLSG